MRDANKKYLVVLSFIHAFVSLSLFYFGQYFFMTFFQIIFVPTLFSYKNSFLNKMIFFVYLMCLHYFLVLLFSFGAYIFYFINLFALIYFMEWQNKIFTKREFLACGIFALMSAFFVWYFEAFIYNMYLYFDVVDTPNMINSEVFVVLTLLHGFMLFFVLFKKDRRLFEI
ncbi:MAG: hypothetical protein NTZ60_01895 [Campylobacterales bacterium]|nr:hypothetical protein [Campylobacterales bacterium]